MEISIRSVSKAYPGKTGPVPALREVSLEIPDGEIFTLLGPSGCGKTTLLRCIVGLETPDAGEIAIGGRVMWSGGKGIAVPPEKRGLGMVFQTYAIWPHLNVFDNVAYPLQVHGVAKDEIARRVAKTLEFVNLPGMQERPSTKLSGGQQQRVALARALVAEPKVILFDEPLSNLDAKLREETRKELRTFLTRLKITAIYVTHDRTEALALSDRVAVMREGRVVEAGSPRDIYFNSRHRFVADFVGRANLIRATAGGRDGDHTIVESGLGRIACEPVEIAAGSAVTLCIRPESIRLATDTSGAINMFSGRVVTSDFVGDSREVELDAGGERLLARIGNDIALAPGDEVTCTVAPTDCVLVPA